MTLSERIEKMQTIFDALQMVSSRNAKQDIINLIEPELKDDFNFCLEVLAGKHKLGYTYRYVPYWATDTNFYTIRDVYEYLQTPLKIHDLSEPCIMIYLSSTSIWADFLEPLCNRKFRLGIGRSILPKEETAPMLAKKYEGILPVDYDGWYITEKLDGNRCIAYFDGEEWQFVSRNGKRMNVEFDMSGLPEELVYDGEVISPKQFEMSNYIHYSILTGNKVNKIDTDFNSTSGLINRHTTDKSLVYMIFDVQDSAPYKVRRQLLDHLTPTANNVAILPTLAIANNTLKINIDEILDKVVSIGGEGIMLNSASAPYRNKRTNELLKYKQVQTMDMLVVDTYEGTGKYEGMCGGLTCIIVPTTDVDKIVTCDVGSGLSDAQRLEWRDKSKIVGKIVEIAYFSLSQNANDKGTDRYSLRFPRLKKVREDKITTSEF